MYDIEEAWDWVLQVKKTVSENFPSLLNDDSEIELIVNFQEGSVLCLQNTSSSVEKELVIVKEGLRLLLKFGEEPFSINKSLSISYFGNKISTTCKSLFELYLPYCFLGVIALKTKKCITVSHFAQSLDGKIATSCGKSQWIGNKENLIHAHRMRAVCEGIVIGTNTLKNDNPSLSVRLVKGEDPVKIIIGSSACEGTKISLDDEAIFVTSCDSTILDCFDKDKNLNCDLFLELLYKKGIHSVYIEGGSKTTSSFLKSNFLYIVQLHISPVILGSGISNFTLPEISEISEGCRFDDFVFYPIGKEVMFVGSNCIKS